MLSNKALRREEKRLRLATVRLEGVETAAVVLDNGAVPIVVINASLGTGWPTELLLLVAGDHLGDLRRWRDELSAGELEEITDEALPLSEISYAPLYRLPRKIWGIGLNYVEHAEDLDEASPTEEPASGPAGHRA